MSNTLVIFEGLDGCGKSTQANLFYSKCKNAQFFKEAIYTKANSDDEYAALFAINRLKDSYTYTAETVILDRSILSSFAYQDTDFTKILDINKAYIEKIKNRSVYIFYIDTPIKICKSRKYLDSFEKVSDKVLSERQKKYNNIPLILKDVFQTPYSINYYKINGDHPIQIIEKNIWEKYCNAN